MRYFPYPLYLFFIIIKSDPQRKPQTAEQQRLLPRYNSELLSTLTRLHDEVASTTPMLWNTNTEQSQSLLRSRGRHTIVKHNTRLSALVRAILRQSHQTTQSCPDSLNTTHTNSRVYIRTSTNDTINFYYNKDHNETYSTTTPYWASLMRAYNMFVRQNMAVYTIVRIHSSAINDSS